MLPTHAVKGTLIAVQVCTRGTEEQWEGPGSLFGGILIHCKPQVKHEQ